MEPAKPDGPDDSSLVRLPFASPYLRASPCVLSRLALPWLDLALVLTLPLCLNRAPSPHYAHASRPLANPLPAPTHPRLLLPHHSYP